MALPATWLTPVSPNIWDVTVRDDWYELAAMDQPGSGGSYARDDSSETLVGLVPWLKRYSFRMQALGYSYTTAGTPYTLNRVNPLPHPDEGHLYCESVDLSGYNINGDDTAAPGVKTSSVASIVANTFPFRPPYTRAKATLKFRPHQFPYVTDADMVTYKGTYAARLPEYYRHCSIFDTFDPILQVIAADSEPFLNWVDYPAGGASPQPMIPGPVPPGGTVKNTTGLEKGTVPILFSQAQMVMVWHDVPYDYVCKSYIPERIMACMGKVNSNTNAASGGVAGDPWLSAFPKGTLKLEAPRIKKTVQGHIRPAATNLSGLASFNVDIFLPFSYQNPVMAPLMGGALPTFQGWNAFLWNKSDKWYALQRIQDVTKGLFEYADFDYMFTHCNSTVTGP